MCSADGCSQGTKELNSNGRLWRCKGANGGTTTGWCRVDGVCGPPGKCKQGRPETINASEWKCLGVNGGTDVEDCGETSECVAIHGESCCPVSKGGTCTGPICVIDCETQSTCHVQDVGDGVCRPSCGHLANQQGYGGYGPDGIKTTADDPHIFSYHKWGKTSCSELNAVRLWGSDNWFKIPLINGIEPYDGIQIGRGGECCGRP